MPETDPSPAPPAAGPFDPVDAALAAAFGPDPSVAEFPGWDVDFRSGVRLRAADDGAAPPPVADVPALRYVGRYEIVGPLARGGMGVVYRGRDPALGRDLAVKVLLERHRANPAMVRRFVEEAQVTGQLQHPGVPPVHELGVSADGRLYFTMKLVQGRTLAAILAEPRDPGQDRPPLLDIFLHVCRTVAFAHSRGVVHRDLKPSNVMVGSFGEVQVMDWGLAKVLAGGGDKPRRPDEDGGDKPRRSPDETAAVRTVRAGDEVSTAGSVFGTPAYMPPEQARGEVERIDERADVFGLGAILCVILTGQPPYTGPGEEVRRKAEAGDLADVVARLDRCGADPELLQLARDCLAPDAADRPRDAAAVARAVSEYLGAAERRLREAELAAAADRAAARAERHRRRLATAFAATLVAGLVLGGGGWVWAERERTARRAERTAEANRALAEANRLWGQAQNAGPEGLVPWERALAAAERAAESTADGDVEPEVRDRAARVLADLAAEKQRVETRAAAAARDRRFLEELEEIRLRRADKHRGGPTAARSDDEYRKAFRAYGIDTDWPGEAAAAVRASPIRAALLAALDDWAFQAGAGPARDRPLAVARAADPEPGGWSARVREAMARKDWAKLKELAAADTSAVPPARVGLAGSMLTQMGEPEVAEALLRPAQERHPDDVWLNHELAACLTHRPRPRFDEAVRFHTAAVAARPTSAAARFTLGNALVGQGRLDDAVAAYRQALALRPDYFPALNNTGTIRFQQGRLPEALDAFRAALKVRPDYAEAHNNIGNALRLLGKPDEALAAFREAVRLGPTLVKAHTGLAAMLQERGDYAGAVATFRRAEQLVAEDPRRAVDWDPQWLRDAEKAAALAPRWPALVRGELTPATPAERIDWARFAQRAKQHYALAARLFAEAFAAAPELASDAVTGHRYDAARAAALAGVGQGADSPPGGPERARLRRQALDWLTADLKHWAAAARSTDPMTRAGARETLTHWEQDPDLAVVRGAAADKLPEEERKAWRKFWPEVAALRRAAGE